MSYEVTNLYLVFMVGRYNYGQNVSYYILFVQLFVENVYLPWNSEYLLSHKQAFLSQLHRTNLILQTVFICWFACKELLKKIKQMYEEEIQTTSSP